MLQIMLDDSYYNNFYACNNAAKKFSNPHPLTNKHNFQNKLVTQMPKNCTY